MITKISFYGWIYAVLILVAGSCNYLGDDHSTTIDLSAAQAERFTLGGAPVEVVVSLSQKEISITDSLTIIVNVEYDETVRIIPPYLSESVYAPLMLVKPPTEDTSWSKDINRMVSSWHYQFEPVTSGEFTIKPLRVFFRLGDQKAAAGETEAVHKIETEAISYTVTAVEIDETEDIHDIKGLILPEYNFLPLMLTLLGIASTVLLILLLRRYREFRKKNSIPIEANIDYTLEALKLLDELEAQDLIHKKEFHTLHTQLSVILRGYIEKFYGVRAQEQTTEEFIKHISQTSIFSLEQRGMLHQFLSLADLVKFATFDPGTNSSSEAMKGVRSFIETTGKPDEV